MIRSLILFFWIQILSLGSSAQVAVKDCNPGYFIKSYHSSESKIEAQGFCVLKNNHSITVGLSPNDDVNDNSDAFLLKVDGNGNKLLEKVYGGTGHQSFSKILGSGDGNLVAAGIETLGQDFSFFITRLDTSANVLWKRSYAFTLGVNFAITDLQEDRDGSIYMTCFYVADGLSFYDRVMYVKFDANGNMRYAKSFIPPGDINDFFPYSFLIDGDYTYITGNYHSYYHYDGFLMKIKNATGELLWAKNYDFNGGGAIYFQVFPYNNQLCIIGNNDVYETDTSIILVCDTSGKVQNTHYMQGDDRRQGKAVMDAAGDITWLNYNFRYSSVNPIHLNITKMNPAKGVTWSRNFNQLPGMREMTGVGYASDSSLIFSGQHLDPINELKLFSGRLSPSGELACEPETVQVRFGEGTSIAKILSWKFAIIRLQRYLKAGLSLKIELTRLIRFAIKRTTVPF